MSEQEEEKQQNQYSHILEGFLLNLHSLRLFAKNLSPILLNDIIREKEFTTAEELDVEVLLEILKMDKYGNDDVEDPHPESREERISMVEEILDKKHGVELISSTQYRIYGPRRLITKNALEDYKSRHQQLGILYQSTLISLVIYFEMLIASITKHRLIKYPQASDIEDKTLSLDEIRRLGSFENAAQYLIEQEVETLIRKKYTDWIAYIKTNMKLKLENISKLNETVIEIIQRRNLYVHNEGIVNNIYLSNISDELKSGVELGKKLLLSTNYMDSSINSIRHVGVLIGLEYWRMMEKESAGRVNFIGEMSMQLMLDGEWELARDIFQFGLQEKKMTSKQKAVLQINYWLSMKRIGKYSEIKNEIESSDYSDKTRDFQVCYYALIDRIEMFFAIIPKAIEVKEITVNDLKEWPVFDEYRNDERFQALLIDDEIVADENILLEI